MTETNINNPGWVPGKDTIRKAKVRARKFGIGFEAALADQIEDSKAAQQISHERNARAQAETDAIRATLAEPTQLEKRLDRMLGL